MTAATLVIGATGTTSGRVARLLIARGQRVRAASRRAVAVAGAEAVRFDWYDAGTFEEALSGVDRVYLVPPAGDPEPAAVMLPFLEQARASGVDRAVRRRRRRPQRGDGAPRDPPAADLRADA